MTFNELELTAIIKLANSMVMADGKVAPEEVAVMTMELIRFGVPQNKVQTLLEKSNSMEPAHAVALVAAMDKERKKYVASYLGTIMASDGDIDDNEMALWRLLSTICGLPAMNVKEAVENMSNL